MKNILPTQKGFRNESDRVAVAAKIMITKIRKHIEEDQCSCCKQALLNIEAMGPPSPQRQAHHPDGEIEVIRNEHR